MHCDDSDPTWKVNLAIGKSHLTFKIDTGADVYIISYSQYSTLEPKQNLKPVKSKLSSPGGPVVSHGCFTARAALKRKHYLFRIVVVERDVEKLLSQSVAKRMGLVMNANSVQAIGCLKTEPVNIVLKPDAQPFSITVARRIAFPLEEKVKAEISRLLDRGIIRAITKPTQWCAPMVPVQKKTGHVRPCVDLNKLNANIRRERFILPTITDVTSKLSGAKVFSCLDAASGFYQIPLSEECQELTTFITPFGRYCFQRLPFGISSALEIFMRKMTEVLEGLPGVFVYMMTS